MQLVVDVGNTETVVGLVEGDSELQAHWRVSSAVPRTADELTALVRAFLSGDGIGERGIAGAVIGSVVPSVNQVWAATLGKIVGPGGPVLAIGPESPLPIRLDVEEPLTVGADRIVNTLAARELYHEDTIVVDLGTATTFDCITADGVFLGGVIAPGVPAGIEWLASRTAKLPRVELRPPDRVIGRRTETCIQSGIFHQAVAGVDGIVERIRREWGRPRVRVVATGGFAGVIGPHLGSVEAVEPFLTLYGLAMAGRYLRGD